MNMESEFYFFHQLCKRFILMGFASANADEVPTDEQ
jgi:hypothetical protein